MAKSVRAAVKFKIYKKVRRSLTANYPKAFPAIGKRPPLKIGILKEILPISGDDISATQVRLFLGIWTSSTAYLQSVSRGGPRVCIKGTPGEAVSSIHAAEAKEILRKRASHRAKLVDTRK
jgi:sRNA-binding protein